LAGKAYWDKNWSMLQPELLDLGDKSLKNEINLRFHELFTGLIDPVRDAGKHLLEVGCARSVWLPYFARQYGLRVAGLDYSEEGCRQSEAILATAGVPGEVHCADMFAPPESLLGAFDFVFTLGVIEHFTDTASAIAALARFLRPGGTMITVIPNMNGSPGVLQKLSDRAVFDTHVALTTEELRDAHVGAKLQVHRCEYFVATNYYVVNAQHQQGSMFYPLIRLISGLLGRASMGIWQWERMFGRLSVSRTFSPYVVCVARLNP
jgi:2-polyprenyl-3-methyl-5-hydroxy-6-metoxy-1,4-benzoquinol methylase